MGSSWLQHTSCRSEYNGADNLSLCPNQYSESISPPWRRDCLPAFIDVPVIDGVSKKDIARNITVDKTDAEVLNSRSAVYQ